MAKGLLEIQEAEYRSKAALRSAEARHREQKALREAAFAKEETPYAYMNFSMGPPQSGLVQTPKNPGLMGGPQYQSSDLPSGMTPLDVQEMLDYQRQAGTQEITAVPYNAGFRPGQQPTLLNQQQMPSVPMPRQLMPSSNAQLIGATPPTLPGKQQISIPGASPRPEFSADMLRGTQPIDSGQGRFNKNIPNQFGRSASPPMSIPRQQPTLSGKTIQPLSDYARLEPEPPEMPDTSGRSIYEPPQGRSNNIANVESALSTHFPGNTAMQAALMSQFQHENSSLNPHALEERGDRGSDVKLGIGLMQFTDMDTPYPVDEDGNKNGEHQRRAFTNWLADNGRSMDADSTVEYIKQLMTANSVWAKKYHNIGAGNRIKGRDLLDPNRQGGRATAGELSDFMTEHVVGPGTSGSSTRSTAVTARKTKAETIHDRMLQPATQNLGMSPRN